MDRDGSPWLLFDGDCGFCTSAAHWLERNWAVPARAVPWQTLGPDGLSALGLSVQDAQEAAWWIDEHGARSRGHRAIGRSLMACRGWRRAAGVLVLTPPLSALAAGGYWLVVRYRYRLPGATPACR